MKNYLKKFTTVLILLSIITTISSCEKDSTIDDLSVSNLLSDSDLVQQIKNSDLTEINFNSLPQSSKSTIVRNYVSNGNSLNTSFESPSLGYKVNLVGQGRKVDVFFNTEGRELNGEDEGEEEDTDSCWVYTFPITYVMSDGTQILIESENDYTQLENWYSSNPNLEPGFSFVFPITIQYGEGQSTTIGSEEELGMWEENNCNSGEDEDEGEDEGEGEGEDDGEDEGEDDGEDDGEGEDNG